MKFLFKVIILFLILFNFRVPVFYNSAFVSMLLCTFYYIGKRGTIPFTCFYQRYNAVILIGTLILAFVVFLITFLHQTDVMGTREKRIWVEFMMLGATVFALPLLIEGKESTAFEELALIICYAFAIQGVIDFAAYLYTPLGDFLIRLKPYDAMQLDENPEFMERFRYSNLSGTRLVELTASFGVAFIVFFWVQLKSNLPLMKGWKKYFIFCFIFIGTTLSGRTGFIGLLMGLGGWVFFSFNRIFIFFKKNVSYIVVSSLLILFVYFFVFTEKQRQSFSDEVFPFAFEWYYNYEDYGKLEVNSMEATQYHYYYLYDETLLKGHGLEAYGGHGPYPHSDAGYTNTLVFGGIPLLLCLIIYQCLYFVRPISIALNRDRVSIGFFILLFLYIFIAEIKAPMVGSLHVIEVMYLALGFGYIIQYHSQKEQNELTG